jgi:hypothetical protein
MWSFLIATACLASEPSIRLPVTEDPSVWQDALSDGSLTWWHASDAPPAVSAEEAGDRWKVTVRDVAGVQRQVFLSPPHSDEARIEFTWLIVSLLRPLPRLGVREPPPLEPTPRRVSKPSASRASTQPSEAPPTEEAPPPDVLSEEPPAERHVVESLLTAIDVQPRTTAAPRGRTPTNLWIRTTPLFRLHDDGTNSPGGSVTVGAGSPRLYWGAEVGWSGAVNPPQAGPWSLQSLDLWIGAWSQPRQQVSLGFATGTSRRVWSHGAERLVQPSVPKIAFESGLRKELTGVVTLVPTVRLEQDLAPTTLVLAGVPAGQIAPTLVSIRLNVEWTRHPMDPSGSQRAPSQ